MIGADREKVYEKVTTKRLDIVNDAGRLVGYFDGGGNVTELRIIEHSFGYWVSIGGSPGRSPTRPLQILERRQPHGLAPVKNRPMRTRIRPA